MTRIMTLEIPNDIDESLRDEAHRTGKTREQVALEWSAAMFSSPSAEPSAL